MKPSQPMPDEVSLSQTKPPEVFVCQFDEEYSPNTPVPRHATMIPTNFLQIPTGLDVNSMNLSSKYTTPQSSMSSIETENSFSSSQESVEFDYTIPPSQGRLLHGRRKSLSENNLAALCKVPSLPTHRRCSSSLSLTKQNNNSCRIKIADDTFNLSLPKPLKKKITKHNSYLAISVSQNLVRNKHGGSTDV